LSHKGKVCKLQKLLFFKLVSQTHSQSYIGQKKMIRWLVCLKQTKRAMLYGV